MLSYLGNQVEGEGDSHIRGVLGLPYIVILLIYLDVPEQNIKLCTISSKGNYDNVFMSGSRIFKLHIRMRCT